MASRHFCDNCGGEMKHDADTERRYGGRSGNLRVTLHLHVQHWEQLCASCVRTIVALVVLDDMPDLELIEPREGHA